MDYHLFIKNFDFFDSTVILLFSLNPVGVSGVNLIIINRAPDEKDN